MYDLDEKRCIYIQMYVFLPRFGQKLIFTDRLNVYILPKLDFFVTIGRIYLFSLPAFF